MSGSIVDARDELGETALSCAVAGGHEECVRCLPCLTSQGEGVARSPPQRVKAHDVRSFHPGQVRCLLHAGADALLVAGCELTALQLAVVRGHTAIARLLWEHTGAHLASAVRT